MKRTTIYLISLAFFAFAVSCQNSGTKNNDSGEMNKENVSEMKASAKAKLNELREKSNDLADKISNATYAERKILQDDIEDFVDESNELMKDLEADSELENNVEEMIDNIEERTYILVEEAKKFGDKTEEQWEETSAKVESKMKEIGDEIKAVFSE